MVSQSNARSHSGSGRAKRKLHTYELYGLRLRTSLDLPCAEVTGSGAPDVEIIRATEEEAERACQLACDPEVQTRFYERMPLRDGGRLVRWKDHFEFFISSDASRVLWRNLRDTPDEVLHTYLLGQVLSLCMVERGIEPLHATSVILDGGAVAFLGDTGYGKSTLGAAFVARGFRLLTDDVLVIYPRAGRYWTEPGLGRIKLLPDSADALFDTRPSTRMNYFTSKMIFRLEEERRQSHPVPLRAIYVLSHPRRQPKRVCIRRLSGRRALLPLLRNTFNPVTDTPSRLQQQLQFAAGVANSVSIKALSYPRRLEAVSNVVEAIERDLTSQERR